MNIRIYALGLLLSLMVFEATALSCAPLRDRVVAECKTGSCSEMFFIEEISAHGACSRKPRRAEVPVWAKDLIEFEVARSGYDPNGAIYELVLERSYWDEVYLFSSAKDYFEKRVEYDLPLNAFGSLSKLTENSLANVEAQWHSTERRAHNVDRLVLTLDWLSLSVLMVLLVFSCVWFNDYINGRKSNVWLVVVLVVQSLIFLLALVIAASWEPYVVMYGGLVVPFFWIYQLVLFLCYRFGVKDRLTRDSA